MTVRSIDSEGLRKLALEEKRSAIVLFAGEWCGDCAAFAPLWKRWTSSRKEAIYRIEIGHRGSPEWDDWELDEIPTVISFVRGAEKARSAGTITAEDLDALARGL